MTRLIEDDEPLTVNIAELIAQQEAQQAKAQAEGLPALLRLVEVAQRGTGQSRIVARFLLGLWNGPCYGFDLTDLRGLDADLHDDCLAVLRLDQRPAKEVHQYVTDGHRIFDELRERYTTERDRRAWGESEEAKA